MPSRELLSRNEMVERSGVPNDALTFWIRQGLIVPDEKRVGRGGGQRFAYYEANIAAIMLQFRDFGCNIDTLLGFASLYREAIAWGLGLGLSIEQVIAVQLYMNAVKKHSKTIDAEDDLNEFEQDVIALKNNAPFALTNELIVLALDMDKAAFLKHSNAFTEIMVQPISRPLPVPTYFWRAKGKWQRGEGSRGQLRASVDGAFATFAIDAVGILYNVWSNPSDDVTDATLETAQPL